MFAVASLSALWTAQSPAAAPETEIGQLLEFVAQSGCSFERNGSSHDSVDAADHLRLKYRRGKRYVASAEQFIDRLATESSWTGKPYMVRCEGQEQPSGAWLYQALERQRSAESGGAQD
jgi:hypothetical protein